VAAVRDHHVPRRVGEVHGEAVGLPLVEAAAAHLHVAQERHVEPLDEVGGHGAGIAVASLHAGQRPGRGVARRRGRLRLRRCGRGAARRPGRGVGHTITGRDTVGAAVGPLGTGEICAGIALRQPIGARRPIARLAPDLHRIDSLIGGRSGVRISPAAAERDGSREQRGNDI
jgi:hypothetical protein